MRIGHIELFVQNPLQSRSFYVDVLGFEEVALQEKYIWIKCGTVEILLRPTSEASQAGAKAGRYQDAVSAIVLYTNSLNSTAEALRLRGLEFKGTDGSDNCLTFTDPDGHWFQLVDPAH